MKLTILTLATAAVLSTSAFAAETNVTGGEVKFTGEFVNAACSIDMASMNRTVELGQYSTQQFPVVAPAVGPVAGLKTANRPFSIVLNDCATDVQTEAQVGFNGTTAGNTEQVVVNAPSNKTAATGVAIQIIDSASKAVKVDGSYGDVKTLQEGQNSFDFNAYYITTGDALTAGVAHGSVTFMVKYK